jgi:hypothetical protein
VKLRGLLLCGAFALVSVPAATPADPPSLVGTVGPGATIFLKDASGNAVQHLDPGTYQLLVHDLADIHDFHLAGGNGAVNVATEVEFVGDQTFTITLVDGTYTFYCDPHLDTMRGSFTVGTVKGGGGAGATPAAAKKLFGSLSAAGRATLGPRQGARAKAIKAGAYKLTVKDQSKQAGFKLAGPGVSRTTGGPFTGSVTWSVTLKKGGVYRYGAGLSLRAT